MTPRALRKLAYTVLGAIPSFITLLSSWMLGLDFMPDEEQPMLSYAAMWVAMLGPWFGFFSLTYVIGQLGEVPKDRVPVCLVALAISIASAWIQSTWWLAFGDGVFWAVPAVLSGIVYFLAFVEICLQSPQVLPGLETD